MLKHIGTRVIDWMHARTSQKGRGRWHRATSAGPVLLRDGTMSTPGLGQLWRRQSERGWEYEQDDGFDEPDDDLG